jgi:hypothetical protein
LLRIRITKDEEVVVRGGLEESHGGLGIWAGLTLQVPQYSEDLSH